MKTFSTSRQTILLVLLLAPFIFLNQSCKKADTVGKPSIPEEFSTQASTDANALPHTKQYSSEVATAWFNLLTNIARTKPYTNPPALRIFAYSGLALYESVVPGMPSYQSMYKHLTGNTIDFDKKKNYYWPACANAAIARVATRTMQDYSNPNIAPLQALESSLNASFQLQVTPENLQLSNDFGKHVGDVIYEWGKTDGTFNSNGSLFVCPPYVPLGGPGNWVPTPTGFFPAVGACQSYLRTFVPNIVNTALPAPPPAYSTNPSSVFYQAANEVYQRRNNITADETRLFNSWRDLSITNYNPPSHTLKIATEIIIKEQLNLEDASVFFAKQTMAAFDAIASVFKAKFHYALLRPVTYIRGVMGFTTWNSAAPTPQHPSYVDELNATASTVEILESYFGNNYAVIDSTQQSNWGSFSYPSLDALVQSIVEARVSGGTTFRFCGDAAIIQGRVVGEMINTLPFKKP